MVEAGESEKEGGNREEVAINVRKSRTSSEHQVYIPIPFKPSTPVTEPQCWYKVAGPLSNPLAKCIRLKPKRSVEEEV
jgi:hypothetical protein